MDDHIIAMDINIQVGQTDATCQLVQGVNAVRAELVQSVDAAQAQTTQRFAYVAQQIAGLE